jgi:predicted RNase H-like nuclease
MSQISVALAGLKEKAKERPEGYYEDAVSRGKIVGEFLLIDGEELKKLVEKYRPKGVGDYVEEVLRPLARVLDMENCPRCKKRKAWLNRVLRLH